MKPEKLHNDVAILKRQITLQKLARHSLPLFASSTVTLTLGLIFFMYSICNFALHGTGPYFICIAIAFLFTGISVVLFSLLMFGPKGLMAKQCSEELNEQNLDILSEDELHTLIEFHRSQKNIAAADKASRYLMLKLEKEDTNN